MRRFAPVLVASILVIAACGDTSANTDDPSAAAEGSAATSSGAMPEVPPALPGSFVVGALQEALYITGYDPGVIDGLFGPGSTRFDRFGRSPADDRALRMTPSRVSTAPGSNDPRFPLCHRAGSSTSSCPASG